MLRVLPVSDKSQFVSSGCVWWAGWSEFRIMGFSPTLQGRAAHEALIARQDAEIRLLENIKRCLANKVKCDKEYASALSSVATQGQKLEKCEELSGTCPVQIIKNYVLCQLLPGSYILHVIFNCNLMVK